MVACDFPILGTPRNNLAQVPINPQGGAGRAYLAHGLSILTAKSSFLYGLRAIVYKHVGVRIVKSERLATMAIFKLANPEKALIDFMAH